MSLLKIDSDVNSTPAAAPAEETALTPPSPLDPPPPDPFASAFKKAVADDGDKDD